MMSMYRNEIIFIAVLALIVLLICFLIQLHNKIKGKRLEKINEEAQKNIMDIKSIISNIEFIERKMESIIFYKSIRDLKEHVTKIKRYVIDNYDEDSYKEVCEYCIASSYKFISEIEFCDDEEKIFNDVAADFILIFYGVNIEPKK